MNFNRQTQIGLSILRALRKNLLIGGERQTLIVVDHPNHFEGKLTIVASFPYPSSQKEFEKIVSSFYEGDLSPYRDYLAFVLTLAHEGLRIEDRDEFLKTQFPEIGKDDICPASLQALYSGDFVQYENFPIGLTITKEVLDLAKEENETSNQPKIIYQECRC